ncbi:MAG: hypothetical protein ABFD25_15900 [Clostridiaceae bacterium]
MSYGTQSLLDNIRLSNGPEGLKNFYHDLLRRDSKKAFELVNDNNLHFDTLFLLRSELSKTAASDKLNPLYREALRIAEMLVAGEKSHAGRSIRSGRDEIGPVLRWMVKTGCPERYCGAELENYEQLMEISAALLTKSFRDTSALPEIAEMIFERNRDGRLIHDLVWAFFEARNPESLLLIAERLVSPYFADAALAKRLLCFIPGLDDESTAGPILYNRVLNWLGENRPFMSYTGENLHLCNLPRHYAVSLSAKYLRHPVSIDRDIPLPALNEFERCLAMQFDKLPEHQQQCLADFSHTLHKTNIRQWNAFLQLSADQQANLALSQTGRRDCYD